jgi:hypothetical protein
MSQSSERSTRVTNFEKRCRRSLVAKVVLFLLCCVPSLLAQAAPGRATSGKEPAKTVVPATSAIQFDNVIEPSKIKFKLRNSVSPHRYTSETMAAGVAATAVVIDQPKSPHLSRGSQSPVEERPSQKYSLAASCSTRGPPTPEYWSLYVPQLEFFEITSGSVGFA